MRRFSNLMMNSYRRNDGRNVRRLFLVTALVIIIFAADIASGGILRSFARGASASVSITGSRFIGAITDIGFFSSRRALTSENKVIKQELERLKIDSAEIKVLREEVRALRALVHLGERYAGITAPVVSSAANSPYGTFVIAAGEADGIAAGDLVLAGAEDSSFVIGRVSETAKSRSLVTEIFAPGAHIEILIRGAPFTLEGRGGGNARIEVPASLEIEAGDPVFAPELGGLPVGSVGYIHEARSAAYKNIFIRNIMPISSLRFVYVISNEK